MLPITVLVPYFNAAKHLGTAIETIAQQLTLPSHVIMYDDGSTDDSRAIATALTKRMLEPLGIVTRHIESERNNGRGFARQVLANESATELSAWLDADDMWHPAKLASQYLVHMALGHAGAEIVLFGNHLNQNQSTGNCTKVRMPREITFTTLFDYGKNPRALQLQTTLGPTALFQDIGFDVALNWSEDLDFAIRLLDRGYALKNSCTHRQFFVATYKASTPTNWSQINTAHAYLAEKHMRVFERLGVDVLEYSLHKELKYTAHSYATTGALHMIDDLLMRAAPYAKDPRFGELYAKCQSTLREAALLKQLETARTSTAEH